MTRKSSASAPVVKKSDLARVIPTRPLTPDEIKAHSLKLAREVADIITGKKPMPARLRNDDEHDGQVLFFQIELPKLVAKYGPPLDFIFAIPNFSMGHKSEHVRKMMGARANAEGRKKGVFDICFPLARGDWHALYLEAKVDTRPSAEQKEFQRRMMEAGNLAIVVYGVDAKTLAANLTRLVSMYVECGPYGAMHSIGQLGHARKSYLANVWEFR